jgi:hypothetical protein
MNNWAFNQLCTRVGAPASYLADKLPAELAAQCLKNDLSRVSDDKRAVMLIQSNGSRLVRGLSLGALGAANSPAKPPALPERIEAVLQLRE